MKVYAIKIIIHKKKKIFHSFFLNAIRNTHDIVHNKLLHGDKDDKYISR